MTNELLQVFDAIEGRIGILGGTFDPVHKGHIQIAHLAMAAHNLSSIVFIPNKSNPLKSENPVASDTQRLEMLNLAVKDIPSFFVSDVEIKRETPSYTVETLKSIKENLSGESSLFFILGSDSLLSFHKWFHVEEILKYASIIPVARRDFPYIKLPELNGKISDHMIEVLRDNFVFTDFIDISATELRQELLVAPPWPKSISGSVLGYIKQNDLYRSC